MNKICNKRKFSCSTLLENVKQESEIEVPVKRRGRPKKVKDAREWMDAETTTLIEIWSKFENLYNTKHESYFNRAIRQKTLEIFKQMLHDVGLKASIKQICKKLTDLKNYYGAQLRMIENSKLKDAVATGKIYFSSWRFFDSLYFLSDAFTSRKSQSRIKLSPCTANISSSSMVLNNGVVRKMVDTQIDYTNQSTASASNILKTSVESNTTAKDTPQQELMHEDTLFCDLLKNLLSQIPDCESKDDLKINIQRMANRCKRQLRTTHGGRITVKTLMI